MNEYRKYVTETLLHVYSKTDFHPNVIDQIICDVIPTLNKNNRFDLKITRSIHNNNIQELKRLLKISKNRVSRILGWFLLPYVS